jgi:hypothetical protein
VPRKEDERYTDTKKKREENIRRKRRKGNFFFVSVAPVPYYI